MHHDPSFLQALWFVLIGVLWAGYFVLEGFDFGVGMLVRVIGRDQTEKRMIIHTVGPVWDGNEVWLLVAGGATFAAFPGWYASAFSGFYLALFLVLAALIVRGVSFEFWGKVPSQRWRDTWEWALAISSGAAALLFGVAWANFIHGVPMDSAHNVQATLFDLLHPYALLGGLTTLSLFFAHGAGFLTLRTSGDVQARAGHIARRAAPVAAGLTAAFLVWTMIDQSFGAAVVILGVVALAAAVAWPIVLRRGAGSAGFIASTATIVAFTVVLLVSLYPNALPSTTNHAFDLTLVAASSTSYTLTVMTVVAVLFLPVVLAYQVWTYWVFRHRLGRDDFEGPLTPIAVLEHRAHGGEPGQKDGSLPIHPSSPPAGVS
ncbi:MAG TPA: cytochrome d ubiquinol oxidase subunit II [Solirubrobacteraceae bacterium]